MIRYVTKRAFNMVAVLLVVSIVSFIVIQLPPGDFLTTYMGELAQRGQKVDVATIAALTKRYGLDQPIVAQYLKWIGGILHGDFGYSFEWNRPVSTLIGDRLGMTLVLVFFSMVVTYCIAFPIGIYSATHKYSLGDYGFTAFGLFGIATPEFLVALILMWLAHSVFSQSVGGLFSPQYVQAQWSVAKTLDLLAHLWIPAGIIGLGSTAVLMRTLRANLLDEIMKPYVEAARAKGLREGKLLFKYPVRIAVIPFLSTIGWTVPFLISGQTIISIVLGLPTVSPLLLQALRSQDMYLAGSIVFILSALTVLGTFISDMLLVWADPRIRMA